MRSTLIVLSIIFLFVGIANADTGCIACSEFVDAKQARITTTMDQYTYIVSFSVYYEDPGGDPSRKPINNTMIIVELTNQQGLADIYKIYTDDEGNAQFDFTNWKDNCLNIKLLYCPFCTPDDPECGFAECLQYSDISNESSYYASVTGPVTVPDDIPDAIGATPPSELNPEKFFPEVVVESYCPPPPPMTATPALCLPLIIIFALLSGALYYSGKNPFAAFNLGRPRIGRHIRYQARGRGFSFSTMAGVSAIQSVAGAAKAIKKGGMKGLVSQEKKAARARVFGVSGMKRAVGGIRAVRAARKHAKGKGADRLKSFSKNVEAIMGGQFGTGDTTRGTVDSSRAGLSDMPMGAGVRGSELAGGGPVKTFGKIALFLFSQTTLGRCVDGMIGVFQPYGASRGLFEMIAVDRSERKQNDLEALGNFMAMGADGNPVGMEMKLPDGTTAIVTGFSQKLNEDGDVVSTTLVLAPAEGAGIEGSIALKMDGNNNITRMEFNVPAGVVGEKPTTVIVKMGPEAKPDVFIMTPNELAGEPGQPAMMEKRLDSSDPAYTKIMDAAYTGTPPGMELGADASKFVDSTKNSIDAMAGIAGTIQFEAGKDQHQVEDELVDKMGGMDKAREAAEQIIAQKATGEVNLSLGEGLPETKAGRAEDVFAVANDAIGESDIAKEDFSSDIVKKSGIPEEHPYHGDVSGALDNIVANHSASELSNMAPEALEAEVDKSLASQGLSPAHIKSAKEGVDFSSMASGVNAGGKELISEINEAGKDYSPEMRNAMANADVSQIHNLSNQGTLYDRTVGGNLENPVAILASDPNAMDNPNVPKNAKYLMAEYVHNQNVIRAAGAVSSLVEVGSETAKGENITAAMQWGYAAQRENASAMDSRIASVTDTKEVQGKLKLKESLESIGLNEGTRRRARASQSQFNAAGLMSPPVAQPKIATQKRAEDIVHQETNFMRNYIADGPVDGYYKDHADAARQQADLYRQQGHTEAAKLWNNVATELDNVNADIAKRSKAGPPAEPPGLGKVWSGLAKIDTTSSSVGRKEASKDFYAQQTSQVAINEARTRQTLDNLLASGDYGTAASTCANQARYYRGVGNNTAAKAYEEAATQMHKRREATAELDRLVGAQPKPGTKKADKATEELLAGALPSSREYRANVLGTVASAGSPFKIAKTTVNQINSDSNQAKSYLYAARDAINKRVEEEKTKTA